MIPMRDGTGKKEILLLSEGEKVRTDGMDERRVWAFETGIGCNFVPKLPSVSE